MNTNRTELVAELEATIEASHLVASLCDMAKAPRLDRNRDQRFTAWLNLQDHCFDQCERLKAPASARKRAKPAVTVTPEPPAAQSA